MENGQMENGSTAAKSVELSSGGEGEQPKIITTKCAAEGNKFLVPLFDILVRTGRSRKTFEDIEGMADSIWTHGLINPITIEPAEDKPGKFYIVAGERRFRAHMLLHIQKGLTHAHCNLRTDLTELSRTEIELEENLRRKPLDSYEQLDNLRRLDEIKRKMYGDGGPGQSKEGWTNTKTAEIVGQSQTNVTAQLNFAKKLHERPDLKDKIKHLPINVAMREVKRLEQNEEMQRKVEAGHVKVEQELQNLDAVAGLKTLASDSVDCVIIDPPFGITVLDDMEGETRGESRSFTGVLKPDDNSSPDGAKELLSLVVPELARVMKPGAHIYIFHANDQRQYLVEMMEKAGLHHDPSQLLIWDKTRSTTGFTGYNYPSSYEPILFAHKPPRESRRLAKSYRNIIPAPPLDARIKVHPFQKPDQLISTLISNSTKVGEVVLDCFAGSGQTLVSAIKLGRSAIGFEKNIERFHDAQMFIQRTKGEAKKTASSKEGK